MDKKEKKIEVTEPVGKEKKAAKKKTSKKDYEKIIADLNEQIGTLEKDVNTYKQKQLMTLAEFENFRRRNQEERIRWIKNATEKISLELCDVLDNFERALDTAQNAPEYESLHKGVEMIFDQLENVLKQEGVTKIESMGKEFNPEFCEALAHIPSPLPKDTIAAVIKNGYMMNDKLMRPAQVAVSNGVNPEETK